MRESSSGALIAQELLKFLAAECPLLLPAARRFVQDDRISPAAIETDLRAQLGRLTSLAPGEAELQLSPGTAAAQAAGWYREYLEEIVAGFFRRWEIRATITDREKLQMYRWMVLTRTLDNRLKELFDKKDMK